MYSYTVCIIHRKLRVHYVRTDSNERKHTRQRSSLKTGPARPGHAKIALYTTAVEFDQFSLYSIPVQWPGMIDSASSDFTVCIKGLNIGSFKMFRIEIDV